MMISVRVDLAVLMRINNCSKLMTRLNSQVSYHVAARRGRAGLIICLLLSVVAMSRVEAQVFVTDDYGITEFSTPLSTGTPFYADSHEPAGLAYYNGSLYVSNYLTGTIQKLSSTGTATTFASGFTHLEGIVFDGSGDLYVLSQAGEEIDGITTDGIHHVFATTGLSGAADLVFDSSGNLYASNLQNNTIEKFSPSGTPSLFASANLNEPYGITFDNGNIYVASFGNNLIEKFTLAGVGSTFLSSNSAVVGPEGLTTDSAGNLWVTNNGNQGIYEITVGSSGTATSVTHYAGDGNFPDSIVVETVPEPASWTLLLGGLGVLAFRYCRSRI